MTLTEKSGKASGWKATFFEGGKWRVEGEHL
ncbi:hypothetical protein ACFQH5_12485 [Halomonas salifodinae]|uniref:Omega-protein n=1 Tax=Halomonas salifodinae TaxID=438745 RepID=A0ABW2EWL2_9GAMM